ncbi:MAG: YdcF family protein [Bacillota bacterium]
MREHNRHNVLLRVILGLFFLAALIFSLLLALSISSSQTDATGPMDAVLILGAGLDGDKPRPILQERLKASLYYLYEHEPTAIVVSGGQGSDETISEAEAMKRFLVTAGIDGSWIRLEDRSTSTRENIANSAAIIHDLYRSSQPTVAIVTSGFHLFRAKRLAREYGLKPYGVAARTPPLLLPRYLVREALAIINDLILPR